MPQLIQHIDKIALKKGRTVLFVKFGSNPMFKLSPAVKAARKSLIAFLESHHIAWEYCAPPSNSGWIEVPDGAQLLYVDIPFDPNDPAYRLVAGRLEDEQGQPRDPHVVFCYMPLDMAQEIQATKHNPAGE